MVKYQSHVMRGGKYPNLQFKRGRIEGQKVYRRVSMLIISDMLHWNKKLIQLLKGHTNSDGTWRRQNYWFCRKTLANNGIPFSTAVLLQHFVESVGRIEANWSNYYKLTIKASRRIMMNDWWLLMNLQVRLGPNWSCECDAKGARLKSAFSLTYSCTNRMQICPVSGLKSALNSKRIKEPETKSKVKVTKPACSLYKPESTNQNREWTCNGAGAVTSAAPPLLILTTQKLDAI